MDPNEFTIYIVPQDSHERIPLYVEPDHSVEEIKEVIHEHNTAYKKYTELKRNGRAFANHVQIGTIAKDGDEFILAVKKSTLDLHIKTLSGIIGSIEVDPYSTGVMVKEKIQKRFPEYRIAYQELFLTSNYQFINDGDFIYRMDVSDGDEIGLIIKSAYCVPPANKIFEWGEDENVTKSAWLAEQFGLVKGTEYIFPLRIINNRDRVRSQNNWEIGFYQDNSGKNSIRIKDTVGAAFDIANTKPYVIEEGDIVKGTFKRLIVSKELDPYRSNRHNPQGYYKIYIVLDGNERFSIYRNGNETVSTRNFMTGIKPYDYDPNPRVDKDIILQYYNIIPCEEPRMTGRKFRR